MSTTKKRISTLTAQEVDEIRYWANRYAKVMRKPPSDFVEGLPFFGRMLNKYQHANFLEASYFFLKTGEPVIDQKMLNAFKIKSYEVQFGLYTGLAWGVFFAAVPGWKGFDWRARVFAGSAAFLLAAYRGFRRGYDQVAYVGDVFMEHHLKRKALVEYLRDNNDTLVEFRQHLLDTGLMNTYLKQYGLDPIPE